MAVQKVSSIKYAWCKGNEFVSAKFKMRFVSLW